MFITEEEDVMSKRVLVTGGAGFIGSHLCERLLEDGCSVTCVDDLSTGFLSNIEHLKNHPKFEFINHDVTEPFNLDVDLIFNLACPASPPHYQRDSIKTLKTLFLGVMNLLELAQRNKATMLQASTSEVYGNPLVHPQTEEYWGNVNPIGERSCYDEGKRCAETLMNDYRRCRGVDAKIVRIFNTYGPNMDINDGRVVSNFITQALCGKDITIYGDGTQTRSFCYVSDTIDGMIKMINAKTFCGPVNIGNPTELSVSEFAKIVIELTNSNSKIVYKALPSDDPSRRKPDISLAEQMLDWKPKVALQDGLIKTIEYFEQKLKTSK